MSLDTWPAYADDDGTGQSGTAVNAALLNSIRAAIEAEVSSGTNPTLKAKTIVDEVKTARGSLGSLDTRISVSLNADGTLKIPASVVTNGDYQAGVGSRNIAFNGSFEDWTAGPTSAPDNWTLNVITVTKTGAGQIDTTAFGTGQFAVKLTRAGSNGNLLQLLIAGADASKYTNVKGQKISVAVKGKTAIANLLRIGVNDGVTQTNSSYHTGGNTEEHLSVTHTISQSMTQLDVRIELNNSSGDAYVGGVMIVFSNQVPSDWIYRSEVPATDGTIPGVISIIQQDLGGLKRFIKEPVFKPGGSVTFDAKTVGTLQATAPATTNTNAAETDLASFTLSANALNATGETLRVRGIFTTAANGNNKTIKFYFGASSVTVYNAAGNSLLIQVDITVFRTGASAQSVIFLTITSTPAITGLVQTNLAISNTANQTIKFTGQGTTTGDVGLQAWSVEKVAQ